jgi:putative phage-type endonuclease
MTVEIVVQGSPEWRAMRLGRVTASRVSEVCAKTKSGGYGSGRANLMAELLVERLTGVPTETYVNAAMAWGTTQEPNARAAYVFMTDNDVTQVAFIEHPTIEWCGASPDGLVGDDGMLEIKCPNTATHIETLIEQKIPLKYIQQMQWQLACSGRQWVDYCSYDCRCPEHLELFIKRVHRDNAMIAEMESEVRSFLRELDQKMIALEAYAKSRAA